MEKDTVVIYIAAVIILGIASCGILTWWSDVEKKRKENRHWE